MVSTRTSNKLKKAPSTQKKRNFIDLEDSDDDSIDWETLMEEDSNSFRSKGQASAALDQKKARKDVNPLSMKRKRIVKRLGKGSRSETQSPITPEQPPVEHGAVFVSSERMKAFECRECIGERHVDTMALRNHCPPFGRLIDEYGLAPICSFPEKTGFCVQLVRSFYLNSSNLLDVEGGPLEFRTVVRGTCLTITPQLIGEVIGMRVELDGTNFMKVASPTTAVWKEFVKGVCLPGTCSTGLSVLSRQLKQEYQLLNLIVCFNILPNLQSKVIRWDRMFFLFLFGNPLAAEGVNFNVPYIIWCRMAKYIENAHPNERLPFPMIIMRILRKFGIDTASTSTVPSSGTINASTIAKSRSTSQGKTRPSAAGSSAQASTSDGDISLTSIHYEQQRLSRRQDQMCQELEAISAAQAKMTRKISSIHKLLKTMSEKNGCDLSDESESD